jgi:hypothetical protein
MILKDHFEARVRWGVYCAAEASSPANEAGFGNTAVRPKDALSGAGGAGAAGGRLPQHRCEPADVRDVERADLENRMMIRCAAGADGAWRISLHLFSI